MYKSENMSVANPSKLFFIGVFGFISIMSCLVWFNNTGQYFNTIKKVGFKVILNFNVNFKLNLNMVMKHPNI